MNSLINKLKFIFKEEGSLNLIIRLFRYLVYRIKRYIINSDNEKNNWQILKREMNIKRVFLIGNGPSLNKTPLHLLNDETTFCLNRFNLFFERISWRPDMYGISDDVVILDMLNEISNIKEEISYLFLPDIHPSSPIFVNYKKIINDHEKIYWFHPDKIGFSNNLPSLGLNKTITNVAIQILVFLGFKEIYLVGVDVDYITHDSAINLDQRHLKSNYNDDPNHFDSRYFGSGRKYHIPRMDETMQKYKEAKFFCDSYGVKVYNATIGGKLEIFPRVDFRSIFNIDAVEELNLILNVIGKDSGGNNNFSQAIPKAIKISNINELNSNSHYTIMPFSLGYNYLRQLLPTHLPLGPYNNEYLFINRYYKIK